jgi:hypothetical protein
LSRTKSNPYSSIALKVGKDSEACWYSLTSFFAVA